MRGEGYKWNARLRSIKQNALAPMSPAQERANAVNVSPTTVAEKANLGYIS